VVCASQSVVLRFDDTPAEDCYTMEFRLIYSGRVLGASRTNTRSDLKHAMRREFHPQLRRLWQTNGSLREITKFTGIYHYDDHNKRDFTLDNIGAPPDPDTDADFYRDLGADVITKQWERCGYRFWPLVTEEYCVKCSLDILFLRPEEPGMLIRSGDIDARIKTIFDALRIPKNLDEAGGSGPQADETPFFCLLEDDKLISEIKVTTDTLLLLPREREIKPNDALLVIHVKLWPYTAPDIVPSKSGRHGWAWAFS
jgi:hypothetical protein